MLRSDSQLAWLPASGVSKPISRTSSPRTPTVSPSTPLIASRRYRIAVAAVAISMSEQITTTGNINLPWSL